MTTTICIVSFLSTLSLRRATTLGLLGWLRVLISIHALLAESDEHAYQLVLWVLRFLSTLSLRRATTWARGSRVTYVISIHALLAESDAIHNAEINKHDDFYPRSPCGERPRTGLTCGDGQNISIHALLAESDCVRCFGY